MSAGNTGSSKAFMNSLGGNRRGSIPSTEAKPRSPTNPARFASLVAHKRGSMDDAARARRASWEEQKPAASMVGGWWNKMMKG